MEGDLAGLERRPEEALVPVAAEGVGVRAPEPRVANIACRDPFT